MCRPFLSPSSDITCFDCFTCVSFLKEKPSKRVVSVPKIEKDSSVKPDSKLIESAKSNIVKLSHSHVRKPGRGSAVDPIESPEKLIRAPVHNKKFTDGSISWDCLSPDLVTLGNVRK